MLCERIKRFLFYLPFYEYPYLYLHLVWIKIALKRLNRNRNIQCTVSYINVDKTLKNAKSLVLKILKASVNTRIFSFILSGVKYII